MSLSCPSTARPRLSIAGPVKRLAWSRSSVRPARSIAVRRQGASGMHSSPSAPRLDASQLTPGRLAWSPRAWSPLGRRPHVRLDRHAFGPERPHGEAHRRRPRASDVDRMSGSIATPSVLSASPAPVVRRPAHPAPASRPSPSGASPPPVVRCPAHPAQASRHARQESRHHPSSGVQPILPRPRVMPVNASPAAVDPPWRQEPGRLAHGRPRSAPFPVSFAPPRSGLARLDRPMACLSASPDRQLASARCPIAPGRQLASAPRLVAWPASGAASCPSPSCPLICTHHQYNSTWGMGDIAAYFPT
jgi:hypothetical protein